jgi:hypothetical protein
VSMGQVRDIEEAARHLVDERVRAIRERIPRPLPPHPPPRTTPPHERDHLFEEARDLYVHELRWEQETEEEWTASGELTEMVFPAFLALVDALVAVPGTDPIEEAAPSHRDVVHDLLCWLAERVLTLRARPQRRPPRVQEVVLADRLLDLVLYRYLRLEAAEVERVDDGRV